MDPVGLTGFRVQAVQAAVVAGGVDQSVGDRNGRDAGARGVVRPDQAGARHVARAGGVEAGQPAFSLTVERVLGDCHVDPVVVENRVGHHLVAFGADSVLDGYFVFGLGGRMTVDRPDRLDRVRPFDGGGRVDRVEAVEASVAGPLEQPDGVAELGQRGRTPLTVDDVPADAEVVLRNQLAGRLVDDGQQRRVGIDHPIVRVIQAVGRANVEQIAVQQHGAVGRVVRPDAQLGGHVEGPDDIGVFSAGLQRREAGRDHVSAFLGERPVVAVGHPFHVETDDLAPVGDQVRPTGLHHGRAAEADVVPVGVLDLGQLRHEELPEELAGLFVEAHQHAGVELHPKVTGHFVVRADEHLAAGHHGRAVRLTSEPGGPLDVLRRGQIDLAGEPVDEPGREPVG